MFGQKIDMKQNVQNEKLNQHYKIARESAF